MKRPQPFYCVNSTLHLCIIVHSISQCECTSDPLHSKYCVFSGEVCDLGHAERIETVDSCQIKRIWWMLLQINRLDLFAMAVCLLSTYICWLYFIINILDVMFASGGFKSEERLTVSQLSYANMSYVPFQLYPTQSDPSNGIFKTKEVSSSKMSEVWWSYTTMFDFIWNFKQAKKDTQHSITEATSSHCVEPLLASKLLCPLVVWLHYAPIMNESVLQWNEIRGRQP